MLSIYLLACSDSAQLSFYNAEHFSQCKQGTQVNRARTKKTKEMNVNKTKDNIK